MGGRAGRKEGINNDGILHGSKLAGLAVSGYFPSGRTARHRLPQGAAMLAQGRVLTRLSINKPDLERAINFLCSHGIPVSRSAIRLPNGSFITRYALDPGERERARQLLEGGR